MANWEHVQKLAENVETFNDWRKNNPAAVPDLSGASLTGISLTGVDLHNANLRRINLSDSDLSESNFYGANVAAAILRGSKFRVVNFTRASLRVADMSGADLSYATLNGVDLNGADLTAATLNGADLKKATIGAILKLADLTGCRLQGSIFVDNDLSETEGLELCRHEGPSSIGIDTLIKSRGRIPEAFRRGCGVPEQFIVYARSLVANPIEFYSCFISYSTKDQDFADRLYADLQNKGVRCWFAPHDVQGGKKLHEQIDEAIKVHERLLLILSEASMASEWVKTEIAKARKRELNEKRRVLFPVKLVSFSALRDWECFDGDTGKDSAQEIREYYVPDFSNWKHHDSYQTEFQKLLRDLKMESPASTVSKP